MNRRATALLSLVALLSVAGCRPKAEPEPVGASAPVEETAPSALPTAEGHAASTSGPAPGADPSAAPPSPPGRLGLVDRPAPTNVVILIGDGMGTVHEDLGSRWVHDAQRSLRMQRAPHRALMTTHAADSEVTDSAASATAMSTGRKVNYEVVAMALPGDGAPLETVLEEHQEAGRRTGLVTTSRLTHATPASFAAHVENRYTEPEIAAQMLRIQPTLLFGGGGPGMTPASAAAHGYAVAVDADELAALPADAEAWALIVGDTHVPYVRDGRGTAPSLPDMTRRALELLDGPGGFFLMVEGARIDHASHNNDIARMLPELAEFDDALGVVLEWAEGRDDTLVVLTADHECGGLSVIEHARAGILPEVAWATIGHTSAPVSVYGWDPFGDVVTGVDDNTDLYWLLRWPLGFDD